MRLDRFLAEPAPTPIRDRAIVKLPARVMARFAFFAPVLLSTKHQRVAQPPLTADLQRCVMPASRTRRKLSAGSAPQLEPGRFDVALAAIAQRVPIRAAYGRVVELLPPAREVIREARHEPLWDRNLWRERSDAHALSPVSSRRVRAT